jgi:tetrahydromethanopterin:alpha-L-glutamate ligase
MRPLPEGPQIAIFAEPRDGHATQLASRFKAMGARPIRVRLRDCCFDTASPSGLNIPGFAAILPDAVLVRTVPEGSFEAVTKRLGILHALRELGIPVWNDARAVERCVDKSMTSFLLGLAGIPTPPTWTVENREQALDVARRELTQGALVLKPLFGSQGRGLKLITSEADVPQAEEVSGVYYLQRFVGANKREFHDFRVFVVAGRAVAAMRRTSTQWVTNVKQGGKPCVAMLDPELSSLAVRAATAVGAFYCGIDIIRGRDGQALVLEVNSMPAWSGLQKVTPVDIAQEIAAALLAQLTSQEALRTTA